MAYLSPKRWSHLTHQTLAVSICSPWTILPATGQCQPDEILRYRDQYAGRRRFEYTCRLWTVVLEISVLMAQFPSRDVAQLSYDYRTLGLGFANLGTVLMVKGIPYDSEQARGIVKRRCNSDHDGTPIKHLQRWPA